jgi:hypothetical protein
MVEASFFVALETTGSVAADLFGMVEVQLAMKQ